jgi:hypothetical protein
MVAALVNDLGSIEVGVVVGSSGGGTVVGEAGDSADGLG